MFLSTCLHRQLSLRTLRTHKTYGHRAVCACTVFLCAICGSASAQPDFVVESSDKDTIEEVVVFAHPLSGEGLSQTTEKLSDANLDDAKDTSIGATLAKLPGIRSSAFGKAVGRPVIHGLGGARVKVMEDRIDTLDVSVTSADHAVGVEPFVADRVEVLKGPSTLLYGAGAIGGVIDVHTGRIPHEITQLRGGIETSYDDNTQGHATSGELKGSIGSFAWHLDATFKDGDDYDIPGFTESARYIAAEEAEHEEEHEGEEEEEHEEEHEEESVRGTLPGSHFDSESFAAGGSYIADWGFLGLSISRTEADYGLPGGHHHHEEHEEEHEGEEEEEEEHEEEHEDEEGTPTLELEQTRIDLELGVRDPLPNFTSFNLRIGRNDYEHQELEPNGEVGTDFENDAWELRAELVYELDRWHGAFGIQHTDRDFSAIGEEAFIAPVRSKDTGLFWVGEYSFDQFDLELGARANRMQHNPSDGPSRTFNDLSASIGAVIPLTTDENWQLGVVLDYSNRPPVAEELYSNGPHLVTNAFEVGNADLDSETAVNLAATLSHDSETWNAALTVYHTQFTDFIYEQATGEEEDELPVFAYLQNDATYFGIDFRASFNVLNWDSGALSIGIQGDYVQAEVDVTGNDNIPRTPPDRYGFNIGLDHGPIRANVTYLRSDKQSRTAPLELATGGYEDLSANVEWTFYTQAQGSVALFVKGRNLTDDEQRDHVSFIKDLAPAPGRTLEIGLRARF